MTSKQILTYFNNLKANDGLAFSNIPRGDNQYLTHAYHRYPAKFIPRLAAYLLEKNSNPGDLICDPFGGCGTSLVEAKTNGRRSIGIDINPLAKLISETKITPISPKKLQTEVDKLLDRISKQKQYIPIDEPKLIFWFEEEILNKLSIIYSAIEKTETMQIRRFFKCAFSNILKNCSKWLMKSIKPTIDKGKIPPDPFYTFTKHLNFMVKQNAEFFETLLSKSNKNIEARFHVRDARKTKLPDGSIDYILTSPPYVTSYEYAELHQLSILWFEYTDNWIEFKKKFIGTSHRVGNNRPVYSSIGSDIINTLVYYDHNLARRVEAYFQDMASFLIESKRILRRGKKITLVLGNTTQKGVDILNAEVAYEQMNNLKFKEINIDKRQTSGKSITPYRDSKSGRFTSLSNPDRKKAYEYEYILTALR